MVPIHVIPGNSCMDKYDYSTIPGKGERERSMLNVYQSRKPTQFLSCA